MHAYVHYRLFTTAKIWKQPKCASTDEQIKKIYNELLLSHKKEWNLAIGNNMDGLRGYYARWNKSDRERQILWDFTHMWHLKKQSKWTNITKQQQRYRYREQTGVCQRGGIWGEERNRWGRLRGTNFQLQNKWVMDMKCTVWGI